MDNKVLVIGGIAIVGLLLLSKKKGSGAITNVTTGNTVKTTTNTDGSTTYTTTDSTGAVVSTVVNVKNTDGTVTSTITDAAGNIQTVTNPGNATPVTGIGYVDAVPGVTLGIPTDLYNDYLKNKDLYVAAGKPPPIQYDNTVAGVVTAIPYSDPSKAVTYADPDGTLTFTNANGTPVPNDPAAVVVNAAPVSQPAPVQSSPVTSTYKQSQYDADMALLAKNAPSLLTPQELAKYGGGSTPAAPAPVVADIFTGGLNTDAPYQIINGVLYYV